MGRVWRQDFGLLLRAYRAERETSIVGFRASIQSLGFREHVQAGFRSQAVGLRENIEAGFRVQGF